MALKDIRGLRLSGATDAGLPHYETAVRQLNLFINDPVASVDLSLAEAPSFVMAHALKAYLHLLGTEPAGIPVASKCLEDARQLPATDHEHGHLSAIEHLIRGRWHAASQTLEDLSASAPHDLLALQVGHQTDFFRGDSRMLRDRIARALPAWSKNVPGYHAVLGMHAFGLEETGDYRTAEKSGRTAIELEPRDGWAQHAVAHVMEMQGRQKDGIAWMQASPDNWSRESFFAIHNWWHVALYHLDLGDVDAALALFDGPIYGTRSKVILEIIDASALLWRMHLRGIDVGNRWEPVADAWEQVAFDSKYAFNDAHAMMAFVGVGREHSAQRVFDVQARNMVHGVGDNWTFTREVGNPVTLAIKAFGEGDYDVTVRELRRVRNIANRFGGSHAQRDVLDLTLIEAAIRSGQQALAIALSNERAAARPTSPLARLFVQRAAGLKQAA